MNLMMQHTWIAPLLLNAAWLILCYGLLHVMTGGLALQFVFFLAWMGSGFIWLLFGTFHLLLFMLNKWMG